MKFHTVVTKIKVQKVQAKKIFYLYERKKSFVCIYKRFSAHLKPYVK